ncbi:AI-2E family transporter, partial [Salmonella enterica subsp. enterica]|nr:AI-2E family transporter [Salmonella enterica subsp. enterica serovar Enteritidis]
MSNHRLANLAWVAAISVLFLYVVSPYIQPVLWAVVFAIIFRPVRIWLLRRAHLGRIGSTLVTMLASALLVVIPAIIILSSLAGDIASFSRELSTRELNVGSVLQTLESALPESVSKWINSLDLAGFDEIRTRLLNALTGFVGNMSNYLVNLGQNTLLFFVAIGVMFYLMFFFLNDGDRIQTTILRYTPIDAGLKERMARTTKNVIRATVQGNIVIAAIQGAIGGVTLWFLDIGGSLILGVTMAALSLLPAVGASIVWVPVAIWLVIKGSVGSAVVLVLV